MPEPTTWEGPSGPRQIKILWEHSYGDTERQRLPCPCHRHHHRVPTGLDSFGIAPPEISCTPQLAGLPAAGGAAVPTGVRGWHRQLWYPCISAIVKNRCAQQACGSEDGAAVFSSIRDRIGSQQSKRSTRCSQLAPLLPRWAWSREESGLGSAKPTRELR